MAVLETIITIIIKWWWRWWWWWWWSWCLYKVHFRTSVSHY